MDENKRFVMLGERNEKGRIAKNESYSIEEFMKAIIKRRYEKGAETIKIGFWDLVNPKRLAQKLEILHNYGHAEGHGEALAEIQNEINSLIDKDTFGKKKK